ncbi:MAG: MmgE/PrpD family protein [Rubrivivax sp.]
MNPDTPQTPAEAGFTARLAHWAATTARHWPPEAIEQAQRAFVDTVACMVAGATDEAVRRAAAGLGRWGQAGSISRVGHSRGLDAPWAALLNGTAAHALDYDDVLDPAASHVSAVMVPALLALGEEVGATGMDVVDAYIVGVEVQECLAEAVNMAHYTQGWHTTLTLGAPSAAAACARLLRLGAPATLRAISLATSLAGGFKRQFGTQAKPLHAGLAAQHGIVAARLAAAGLTADAEPLEGARGFGELMVGAGASGFVPAVLERLAGPPAVLRPGLWFKRYPCCASTHRAVDGLLAICAEEGLVADDIAAVRTEVSEAAVRNLMYGRPDNPMQARFSMPYCLAAAALDGDLRLATFRDAAIGRADLLAFLPRVTMQADPRQPADMPSTVRSWATTVVTTRCGQHHTRRVVDPKGYPDHPLTEPDLAAKFADCTSGQPAQVTGSFEAWRSLARAPALRELCLTLRMVQA